MRIIKSCSQCGAWDVIGKNLVCCRIEGFELDGKESLSNIHPSCPLPKLEDVERLAWMAGRASVMGEQVGLATRTFDEWKEVGK